MSPISDERLTWIEARLFILARTAQQLRAQGLRNAVGYHMAPDNHGASLLVNTALTNIQAERLALMAERAAINEYNQESNPHGS